MSLNGFFLIHAFAATGEDGGLSPSARFLALCGRYHTGLNHDYCWIRERLVTLSKSHDLSALRAAFEAQAKAIQTFATTMDSGPQIPIGLYTIFRAYGGGSKRPGLLVETASHFTEDLADLLSGAAPPETPHIHLRHRILGVFLLALGGTPLDLTGLQVTRTYNFTKPVPGFEPLTTTDEKGRPQITILHNGYILTTASAQTGEGLSGEDCTGSLSFAFKIPPPYRFRTRELEALEATGEDPMPEIKLASRFARVPLCEVQANDMIWWRHPSGKNGHAVLCLGRKEGELTIGQAQSFTGGLSISRQLLKRYKGAKYCVYRPLAL